MHVAVLADTADRPSSNATAPLAQSGATPAPSEVIRTLVFMANLSAQEATGSMDASRNAEQLATELALPHPDHETIILALFDGDEPILPDLTTSDTANPTKRRFGLPVLPLFADFSCDNILGWLVLTVPKKDHLELVEAELILDAYLQPLPDKTLTAAAEAAVTHLLELGNSIAHKLGRPHFVLWQQQAASPTVATESMAQLLRDQGFSLGYSERTLVVDAPVNHSMASAQPKWEVFHNANFPDQLVPKVAEVYAHASTDIPHGDLPLQPEAWNSERLQANTEHMRAMGTTNLHVLGLDEAGEILALAEAFLPEGNVDIIDIGLVYVAPQARRQGLATQASAALATAIAEHLPTVQRGYLSIAEENQAALALAQKCGGHPISVTTAWLRSH
ncbi:GNAT family N-acetyltransferase [Corynebacterium epidermidicanis]|uniref:Acetyltransferase (GNAT) family protein n=1 Tax=Corynebacterium epidermidicanis TaxID=1050174 RepID=A0A0G3GQ53_9CORY|nr:GNAT family N-acetyltransferase [Corynebacterium epidermidicanis]AKK03341.1 acetyltransferase (GNAT) family protein [Corynebacterium epidermidicanis]